MSNVKNLRIFPVRNGKICNADGSEIKKDRKCPDQQRVDKILATQESKLEYLRSQGYNVSLTDDWSN